MAKDLHFVNKLDVFAYSHPIDFLRDWVELRTREGLSIRELTRQCHISSPNYFQKVIGENRQVTLEIAKKISQAAQFKKLEEEYWIVLVKTHSDKFKDKLKLQLEAKSLRERSKKNVSHSTEIHEHWLHAALFEMANLKNVKMSPEAIHKKLKKYASIADIERSLEFLRHHGWLVPGGEPDSYNQANVEFDPRYNKRSVDMLTVHRQHLDMAKHRLNDNAVETEFLGLTTAIPFRKMKEVQAILRAAMDEIEYNIAKSDDCDEVLVVHMSAFKITDS